ncbi:hypothetical protein BS78_02G051700 [Paspalum vaginatum]|nr:hypothetical protein BS78_02G051700 [Paspalum vaginatum]
MGSGHQSFRETEENLTRVRRLLGWTDAERCDNVRTGSLPHRNLQPGEFVLFVPYLYCGLGIPISSFFMLLLEAFGLQLQHLTLHSILHAAIFRPLLEELDGDRPLLLPAEGVRGKIDLPPHLRQRQVGALAQRLGDRQGGAERPAWLSLIAVPTHPFPEGASTDLPPEFSPVLARIAELVSGGLTSLHVLADFLRRRLAPLQMRPRLAWSYTGSNDCSRVVRGEDHDLTPLLAGGMGAALRTAVLREMPTLDGGGLEARQLGGDPNRGVHIDDAPIEAATSPAHPDPVRSFPLARTELDADRAAFHEDLQRLIGRERSVGIREKQAEVGEARLKLEQAKLESAWKGVEQRRQELVEVSERQAAVNAELDKMKLRLVEREAAVAAREDSVAQREASAKALRDSAVRQAATLKVREDWVKSREAELASQEKQLLAERAALEQLKQGAAQQAAAEDRGADARRPSTHRRLGRGGEFSSGPVEEAEAAARDSVQEAVEVVAARFQWTPADEDPGAPGTGASPAP